MEDEGQVRILKLNAARNGSGAWSIEFTNVWLPRDIHQFQTALSREYRQYRRELVQGLKRSKSKKDDKVHERTESNEEAFTEAQRKFELRKGIDVKIKVDEQQGINRERSS